MNYLWENQVGLKDLLIIGMAVHFACCQGSVTIATTQLIPGDVFFVIAGQ